RGEIAQRGFAWITRAGWSLGPELKPAWDCLCKDWEHLEPDRYLEGGARFRWRRHGRYAWSPAADLLEALHPEPYFQPKDEKPYAGGIAREFAPLLPDTVHSPFLGALVRSTFACLPGGGAKQTNLWEVRVHQIRIVAAPGQPGWPA